MTNSAPYYGQDYERERVRREQELLRARDARRAEARKREDAAYQRRLREKRTAAEAKQREQAEAEVAAMRARVEADARQRGVPESQLKRVVDEATATWHVEQARETLERGPKAERELRAYFASRNI